MIECRICGMPCRSNAGRATHEVKHRRYGRKRLDAAEHYGVHASLLRRHTHLARKGQGRMRRWGLQEICNAIEADGFNPHDYERARTMWRHTPDPTERAQTSEMRERIFSVLRTLRPRDMYVLAMRYGLVSRVPTLAEVAASLNVSRERVRQIEAKGIRMMQHPERSRKLEMYAS